MKKEVELGLELGLGLRLGLGLEDYSLEIYNTYL
jgi:hypothetical protein